MSRFGSALLVHVTDGSPCSGDDARSHGLTVDQYRQVRREELTAALQEVGVSQMRRDCFGIPDQDAAHELTGLTQRVLNLLRVERPQVLFTHAYEGGHPDHDATVFAVHQAVRRLQIESEPVPVIIEAAFYHAGPNGIETGCFLPSNAMRPQSTPNLFTSFLLRSGDTSGHCSDASKRKRAHCNISHSRASAFVLHRCTISRTRHTRGRSFTTVFRGDFVNTLL